MEDVVNDDNGEDDDVGERFVELYEKLNLLGFDVVEV